MTSTPTNSLGQLPTKIDWPQFIAQQDPIWDRLPTRWEDAAFAGGGLVGTLVFASPQADRLHLWLGRSDIGRMDHALACPENGQTTPPGGPGTGAPIEPHRQGPHAHRRPIGSMDLVTNAPINLTASSMRIDLWHARIIVQLVTNEGDIELIIWNPSDRAGLVVEWTSISNVQFQCTPAWVDDPQEQIVNKHAGQSIIADPEPGPGTGIGGGYAVCWQITEHDKTGTLKLAIGAPAENRHAWTNQPENRSSIDNAREHLIELADLDTVRRQHNQWWANRYRRSFFSMPDVEAESFYWIQLYKFASTTRADRPMCDNHGLWCTVSRYGFATWDMNVQAIHRLYLRANHADLGESLMRFFDQWLNADDHRDTDGRPVMALPSQRTFLRIQTGQMQELTADGAALLIWACHNEYAHARATGDTDRLARLLERLTGAINAMIQCAQTDNDGRLHWHGRSWELWHGQDPNCYLACMQWALTTAMSLADPAERSNDIAQWRQWRKQIPHYAVDPELGLLIGPGKAPAPHRHWSQLMMCLPFDCWHPNHHRAQLLKQSLDHWAQLSTGLDPAYPLTAGFAAASAIIMYAMFDQGQTVEQLLDIALHQRGRYDLPNLYAGTLYREQGPVIESPLFLASALQDLAVQCWAGQIHVFRGVPNSWSDLCFANFLADGGFLVDGIRRNGQTLAITVQCQYPNHLKLHCDLHHANITGVDRHQVKSPAPGQYHLPMSPGQTVILLAPQLDQYPCIQPVNPPETDHHAFGLNQNFLNRRNSIRDCWPND